MAKRWLTSWLFVLFAIGCAVGQSDLAAKAVPDQNNGKDYAGRPVENAPVLQSPVLNPAQKQMVEQVFVTFTSPSIVLISPRSRKPCSRLMPSG